MISEILVQISQYNYASLLIFLNIIIVFIFFIFQNKDLNEGIATLTVLIYFIFPIIVFAMSFGWYAIILYLIYMIFTVFFNELNLSKIINNSRILNFIFIFLFYLLNGYIAYQIFII